MSSSFSIDCPSSIKSGSTIHDCGVTKNVSWTSAGTITGTTFFLQYSQLNNVQPILIFLYPHDKKDLKFHFTPVSNNGSTITVYLYQYIDKVYTLVNQFNLNTLSSAKTFYHQLILNTGVDETLYMTVVTSGGTSGNFNTYIECDPSYTSLIVCTGLQITLNIVQLVLVGTLFTEIKIQVLNQVLF